MEPAVALRPERSLSRRLKTLLIVITALVAYAAIAGAVVFALYRSGGYPSGSRSDAMFYIYRGDFLYRSITQEGNWFPLLDLSWYNGVQTWRYWSPLSAYILCFFQAVMGGSAYSGYLLFTGVFCFLSGVVWLVIGCTHSRPVMGAFLGLIWFLLPANAYMFFAEGVLARSMSTLVLPLYAVSLYDYLHRPVERRWPSLIGMTLTFALILLFHAGWAWMLAICVLIYMVFYFMVHLKKEERVSVGPVVVCMLLGALLTGLWLYPSLRGGITSLGNSSSIMKNYFQTLSQTLNPFYGWQDGESWNRWDNIQDVAYFGLATFALAVFGVLFAKRDQIPGFATSVLVVLLTSTAAYPIVSLLPGSQYLWMLRFLPLALTFLLVSFFFWRTLKRGWIVLFAIALTIQVLLSLGLVTYDGVGTSPEARFDAIAETSLIQEGKSLASQRLSTVEPFTAIPGYVYVTSGYGEKTLPTSYGQGVQAAPNYNNIIQINQAAEDGQFLYMFDRLLEMGNDAVVVPFQSLSPKYANEELLDAAANAVGYTLADTNGAFRLYRLENAPASFGVVSKYRAIAIGRGSNSIALGFPAVEETEDICLDNYSLEHLRRYDVVYLSGFTYHDRTAAERLVTDLSEAGTRVIIMADGIPADEHTGSKTFLGVACNTVNFQNGYPALDTIDGVLICDLFADGYSKDWKTVYLNGLDQVWGTITDVPEGRMDFYGTAKNDNIIFIGLALTYHYSLTLDPTVGALLSHALDLSPSELPQRTLVPITLDYHHNVLTLDVPTDNVNVALGWHDIFRPDRPVRVVNHMTVADQGRTTIRLVYPYLTAGLVLTALGLVLTVAYLILMKRRYRKLMEWKVETDETKARKAEQLRRGARLRAAQARHDQADEELARQEAQAKTAQLQAEAETGAEAGAGEAEAGTDTPEETPAAQEPETPSPAEPAPAGEDAQPR